MADRPEYIVEFTAIKLIAGQQSKSIRLGTGTLHPQPAESVLWGVLIRFLSPSEIISDIRPKHSFDASST
jgi:hypothetical protein